VVGIAALIRPLEVSETVLERHVPFMVLAAFLLVALGWDGRIGPREGVVLLVALVAFTVVVLRRIQRTQAGISAVEREEMPDAEPRDVAAVVGGIVALVLGSRWLIEGGRELLAAAGFTDLFIGLTVLAIGTSLPELAASVVAAVRDEASFSVGNVVGSNIYNVLAVIGILALIAPIEVSAGVRAFEFPALIGFTLLLVGLMYRGSGSRGSTVRSSSSRTSASSTCCCRDRGRTAIETRSESTRPRRQLRHVIMAIAFIYEGCGGARLRAPGRARGARARESAATGGSRRRGWGGVRCGCGAGRDSKGQSRGRSTTTQGPQGANEVSD